MKLELPIEVIKKDLVDECVMLILKENGEVRLTDPANIFSYTIIGKATFSEVQSLNVPFIHNNKWVNREPIAGYPEWACKQAHNQ